MRKEKTPHMPFIFMAALSFYATRTAGKAVMFHTLHLVQAGARCRTKRSNLLPARHRGLCRHSTMKEPARDNGKDMTCRVLFCCSVPVFGAGLPVLTSPAGDLFRCPVYSHQQPPRIPGGVLLVHR